MRARRSPEPPFPPTAWRSLGMAARQIAEIFLLLARFLLPTQASEGRPSRLKAVPKGERSLSRNQCGCPVSGCALYSGRPGTGGFWGPGAAQGRGPDLREDQSLRPCGAVWCILVDWLVTQTEMLVERGRLKAVPKGERSLTSKSVRMSRVRLRTLLRAARDWWFLGARSSPRQRTRPP